MNDHASELRRLAQAVPLPQTDYVLGLEGDGYTSDHLLTEPGYSEDQMRDYVSQTIHELLDRIEAAEKERDALRAKIAEMQRQVPICRAEDLKHAESLLPMLGLKPENHLYALPGAQNVASSQDEWKTLAKDLLQEIERQTCTHEETHRGGFVWEICDSCGAKWADDEGGKPEFKWPKVVERAHAMLAKAPEANP